MKKILLLLFILPLYALSGNNETSWTAYNESDKRFIENKSQFDGRNRLHGSKILFGVGHGASQIYFTKSGLSFLFDKKEKKYKEENNEREREYENKAETAEEYAAHEKKERAVIITTEIVHMQWVNANPNTEIIAENLAGDYFSYTKVNGENLNHIRGYKKLVYKNIYPNIDVEYVFHPIDGIKYSLILHPGANPSDIKMTYSNSRMNDEVRPLKKLSSDKNGNIHIRTLFGDIIDHAPVTFYSNDESSVIPSSFLKKGNEISFSIGNYDKTKTIVIDPWTQAPSFPSTNWDCVWECERDGAGNVYVIGGTSPMQLIKYNSAGVLQWTYSTPYDSTEWLGTFATDLSGNSYIAQGSPARIQKVSTTASLVWNNANPTGAGPLTEFWNITFNCDQTKLVIGGTGGTLFGSPTPYIYNINTNTGNTTLSLQVTGSGNAFSFPPNLQEVRSITSCGNSKYYFLTNDSIGYVHESLTTCLQGGLPFHTSSGANLDYKCENYRYDNSGIMALSYYNGFMFMHRGNQLQKRDFNTAAIIATANIPGGSFTTGFAGNYVGCSGIDIDNCGFIYVGATNAIHKFDQNLNLVASYPTAFNVYDLEVNSGGEVIGCGSTGTSATSTRIGTIQSFAVSACATQSLVCCDATVCNAGPFCETDPSVNLSSTTAGGTWSGTGITNASLGTFNPSIAGTGTFTITYSISCGNDSMQIIVNSCTTPSVCILPNGALSASGGIGPYHWDVQGTTEDCSACLIPSFCQPTAANCPQIITTWTTYSTSTTATPPGTWPIRLVDNNGNILVINSLSGIPACSNLSTTQTNVLCNGQCTGTATVTVISGTPPFTYSWNTSPVQTSQIATGLCADTYTVFVTDATPNSTSTVLTITQPTTLTSTASATSASCGSGGAASVSASGGTSPFTYVWSGGETTSSVNVIAGDYSVTVADANGCTSSQSVTITQPTAITSSVSTNGTNCGTSTGSASVTANGGTGSFSYNWDPGGQTTSSISNLAAGTYSCTITDANGCTQIISTIVNNLNGPSVSITGQTNNDCNGGASGIAPASATGGTTPYTYFWNTTPPQTTATATGLLAGPYTVIATDATGCTNTETVTITEPASLTASTTSTQASCGNSDGTATVNSSGGTSPYTYLWSTTQSNQSVSGLSAGSYSVLISDAKGCTQTATATITNFNGPIANAGPDVTMQLGNSTVLNGSAGTTYSWSPATGLSNPTVSNPTASPTITTTYCVIVSDAGGCTDSSCVTIYITPEPIPCENHFIPNAFSPNGDSENDVLKLYIANIDCVNKYHLAIYNRWGELLFKTIDPADVWDGTHKGKIIDTQVVAYYLYILFTDGKEVNTQGNISLIR